MRYCDTVFPSFTFPADYHPRLNHSRGIFDRMRAAYFTQQILMV